MVHIFFGNGNMLRKDLKKTLLKIQNLFYFQAFVLGT